MDNLPHMCHFDVCCIFINWFPRSAADREQCAPIGNPVQRSHTHERKREGEGGREREGGVVCWLKHVAKIKIKYIVLFE